jgi:anti-anti-sigma factor
VWERELIQTGIKMSIKIENDEEKTSLCIDGELTIYTAQEYAQSIIASFADIATANKNLELDMTDVDEIDTSGLQLLAAMEKERVANGCKMKITSASEVVNEALETSQLLTNPSLANEGCEKRGSVHQENVQ